MTISKKSQISLQLSLKRSLSTSKYLNYFSRISTLFLDCNNNNLENDNDRAKAGKSA